MSADVVDSVQKINTSKFEVRSCFRSKTYSVRYYKAACCLVTCVLFVVGIEVIKHVAFSVLPNRKAPSPPCTVLSRSRDVTERLQLLLRRAGHNLNTSAEMEVGNQWAAVCCSTRDPVIPRSTALKRG